LSLTDIYDFTTGTINGPANASHVVSWWNLLCPSLSFTSMFTCISFRILELVGWLVYGV